MPWDGSWPPSAFKRGVGADIYSKKSNKHHFWAEMAKAGVVSAFWLKNFKYLNGLSFLTIQMSLHAMRSTYCRPPSAFERGCRGKYCKKSNKHHFWAEMERAGVVQHFGWKRPEWFSILAEKLQIFKWASFLTIKVSTCHEMDVNSHLPLKGV